MAFFELQHTDKNSHARTGVITTDHGTIETPIFMPVGTQGAVKTLDSADLANIDAQIILGNNYHLHLRPGEDAIAAHGGLHQFMQWNKPILTDSGGFQVFSLGLQKEKKNRSRYTDAPRSTDNVHAVASENLNASVDQDRTNQGALVSIDEDGVTFKSHIDGSTHRFTPESAIACEHKIGADIIMAFDECTPDDAPREYVVAAMERTHRWALRSLNEHHRLQKLRNSEIKKFDGAISEFPNFPISYNRFLFGIIQGAGYRDLREQSAAFISSLPFDGIAIGGESIGYNMAATADILDWVYPLIPANKPHYAMGIGLNPTDLLVAVEHGVDMFDCVAPTRLARHGMLFARTITTPQSPPSQGGDTAGRGATGVLTPPYEGEAAAAVGGGQHRLNIKNARFRSDRGPIDSWCDCSTCKTYSRSYLNHLFAADEITALRLASIHNLRFMLKLMEETRAAIRADRFMEYKKEWM